MKKKAAIIILIIFTVIVALIASIGTINNKSQKLSFRMPVKEDNVEYTYSTKHVSHFLPVGDKCDLTISANGPEEYSSSVSIFLGSADAEPIYTVIMRNFTVNTGTLQVDNQEIFVKIVPEATGKIEEDKDYAIDYQIELHTEGGLLFDNLIIIWIAVCMVVLAFLSLFIWNMSSKKEYDERQIKVRGAAAMSTLIMMFIATFGLGLMDMVSDSFPLSVYECAIIVVFIGMATFSIIADTNDAYTGIKGKRLPYAIIFSIVGILHFVIVISYLCFDLAVGSEPLIAGSIVQGICLLAIGIEMFIKSARDKKEAAADEES